MPRRSRARRCRSHPTSASIPTTISLSKRSKPPERPAMIRKNGTRFPDEPVAERAVSYAFRPVVEKDLPAIAGWLAEPHVAQWWGDPETEIAAIRGHIDSISVE